MIAALLLVERLVQTPPTPPAYHQLTFRRGSIRVARFAPDGQTVVYSAAWEGDPSEIFSTRTGSVASRSLGITGADVLSVSSTGEMALLLGAHQSRPWEYTGTLARASLAGGAPREILEQVQWADWAPSGEELAVVRRVEGSNRLEFPIGRRLYETVGWISHPRISPKGDRIAFLDHPVAGDDAGVVAVVDLTGKKQVLTASAASIQGLAWSPDAREIFFTASRVGNARGLYAVTLAGKERQVTQVPGVLTLQDIWQDGRILLNRDNWRREAMAFTAGDQKEHNITWLDWTVPTDLSRDGTTVVFDEEGEGGGPTYSVYIRKTNGSPAILLGEGRAMTLSPDGKWVISGRIAAPLRTLSLLPVGPGQRREVPNETGLDCYWARWLPDGKRILLSANEPGHGVRLYMQELSGGKPRPITPEGVSSMPMNAISPDGKLVAAIGPDQRGTLYPTENGAARAIPGQLAEDLIIGWSADGRSLYIIRQADRPARIYKLDLQSGQRSVVKQIMPADPAGIDTIFPVWITPDGKSYVYSYRRILSDLYLVNGLK
jgi:Tol biopolymer transport system component